MLCHCDDTIGIKKLIREGSVLKMKKRSKTMVALLTAFVILLNVLPIYALLSRVATNEFKFTQYSSWQSSWGTLDENNKITWANGRVNFVKGRIPSGSHSGGSFDVTKLSFNKDNGSVEGLTDESLSNIGKGWFQINAANNPDKEPVNYPWRFTFDLGASENIDEVVIISHATNEQVMLNSYELYISNDLESLYTTPVASVEKAGSEAKGYHSLKPEEKVNARYVGISITDFNKLTNNDTHNAGVLLIREFAVLGEGSAEATDTVNYYDSWQSSWGTLDENNKITWTNGKVNFVKGLIPSGSHSGGSFDVTKLSFNKDNGSAGGLTDENLSNIGKGWFQINAANNPDKEPVNYPWRFTFDLGSSEEIEEFLLITHASNPQIMINSYEIYVSDKEETLYSEPIFKAENIGKNAKGYHDIKPAKAIKARYIGLSVTDFNQLTDADTHNSGVLTIREFAVLGKDSGNPSDVKAKFSKTFPSELGVVNSDTNKTISWESTRLNILRGLVPTLTDSPQALTSNVLYEANVKRDLAGLTDGKIAPDGWSQIIVDGNASAEPGTHIYYTFDMGGSFDISEILLSTHDVVQNNFMLVKYKIYVAENRDELYTGKPLINTLKSTGLDEGFHYYSFKTRTARYVGIEVCDPNPCQNGQYGSGIITIKEFSALGEKTDKHELSRIQLKSLPNSTEFLPGDDIDLTGMEILACYTDGQDEIITPDKCKITGYDKNTVGEQTVTVTYNGKSVQLKVIVAKTRVVCEDASVTESYLKSLGENLLKDKKRQVTNGNGTSITAATEQDSKGIWNADCLADGSLDVSKLVRIAFDSSEEMPCTITFDMSRSVSVENISVVGHATGSGDFHVSTYRVYLSDTRENLIDEKNLIISYDNRGKWSKDDNGVKGSAQVFKITEKPKGRFVAFVFDKNTSGSEWGEKRQFLREIGVYGKVDMGTPTNLLANTMVKGYVGETNVTNPLLNKTNTAILTDNDYSTAQTVDFNANNKQVKLVYDLGAGKIFTEFMLACGSELPSKLIRRFKIYASQTEDTLFDSENMIYNYVRTDGDNERVINYILPKEKSYQYIAFVIDPANDGSCILSEVAAIGLSWQLNRIENVLFLSDTSLITSYIEDKSTYSLVKTNTFADRDNHNTRDMSSFVFDGNIGDINVSLFGAKKGAETNNLLIDLQYNTMLNEVDIYGIMHSSLYNAKKIGVYVGANEQDVWGEKAIPVATFTDDTRSGTMNITFPEVVGRYIRISILEGADASVCHGSDLAVISEISANGMSFNSTNSTTSMPSFVDEKTGITLDILPLNYRDYYDTATQMRITVLNADKKLACSLKDFDLRLENDKYFKIELLDKNGKVISDLGGRKATITVPITEKQQDNLIYLSEIQGETLKLLECELANGKFEYSYENNEGTILLGFVSGYYYSAEELEELNNGKESHLEDDDISFDNPNNQDTDETEKQTEKTTKVIKKVIKKSKDAKTSSDNMLIIVAIVAGAVIIISAATFIIIYKRRKGMKND